jgi:hypothetical protein
MTSEAAQAYSNVESANDSSNSSATLDERRNSWRAAKQSEVHAEQRLAEVARQLDANAKQYGEDKAELQATQARLAQLQEALKASAKRRDELRAEQKNADRTAKKARHRAHIAEAKYDSALLEDMLRKQKATDLSRHDDHIEPESAETDVDSGARATAAAVTAQNAHPGRGM